MPACTSVRRRLWPTPSRRSTSKIEAVDPNRTLRQYFDQLDVFADGSDLIFSVAIAGNQLLPLAGALAMQHAGSISASANMTVTTDGSDD